MAKTKGNDRRFSVPVRGIGYPEFALLKWQQFLRGFSLVVALIALLAVIMALTGKLPKNFPLTGAAAIVLVVMAILAIYRSAIRREHKQSGLASALLLYTFDRDGWSVKSADGLVTVPWSKTFRIRRTNRALMLYPNRRSVNLVPTADMSKAQIQQIIDWCTGKK